MLFDIYESSTRVQSSRDFANVKFNLCQHLARMLMFGIRREHFAHKLFCLSAGVHGRQQMHRRASQTARGGASECPKVRGSRDFRADVLLPEDISSCLQFIPNQRQQNNVVWF